ncbi:MAG: histidine--tRNA ligase [Saprospiraceae bacterium]|nr:histidine--tRNA ligase [Candidatus Vicinibacter affinis]MBP6523635.1 histidine--tRNA ligase [Saprospiraceae bacterium]MBK7302125.1 histidine--tRNA ligase [Candidatus Vicinibacter affinis]MBK7693265.1 histidine--tRNA ligase [Candidatus Vicinibacter affinis]MBK7798074.1 histidine--tRNA ligase [Candidatus Vicinibacter affinis]
MSQKPSLAKGTRDFLPLQTRRRKFIFKTIEEVFIHHGYQPLETPAMENLSTLMGKYGEEGDKLLFKIINSGDFLKDANSQFLIDGDSSKLLSQISEKGLRYDLTVPLARVVSMNRHLLTFPFKRYQIQPVWRADRPQRGRYREFYQCDADVVGSNSLLFEAELLKIYDDVFKKLGIPVKIVINHRDILEGIAQQAGKPELFLPMTMTLDKLDKIGEQAVKEELVLIGYTEDAASGIIELIKKNNLSDFRLNQKAINGVEALEEVYSFLQEVKTHNEISFDPSLARGLGYYTGCIVEVIPTTIKMGSLGGGGRYDNLTGVFGLEGVSGVGISFGADRIYDVMNELSLFPYDLNTSVQILITALDLESLKHGFSLAGKLREKNVSVDVYPEFTKLKKSFKYAEDLKIPNVLIIGEEERLKEIYPVKDQISGIQEYLKIESIIDRFSRPI